MSRHPLKHFPDATRECPRCANSVLVRKWWTHTCRPATTDSTPERLVLTPPPDRQAHQPSRRPTPLQVIEVALRQAKRGVACARCCRLLAAGATCECGGQN